MATHSEFFISVDIEASGPVPGLYSLLSIGACNIYNPEETFECLLKPVGKFLDEEAVKVTGLDLEVLKRDGLDPDIAMRKFGEWVAGVNNKNQKPVFVGLNAAFDWSFINYYFSDYRIRNPFGFAPLDLKSMYFGATNVEWNQAKSSVMAKDLSPVSKANHNALMDALAQAELFRLIVDKYKT